MDWDKIKENIIADQNLVFGFGTFAYKNIIFIKYEYHSASEE